MKIGDVAAPSALLRSPLPQRGGAGFLETLGSVQRAYRARSAPRLYEVAPRQERGREFDLRQRRLDDAARALTKAAPEAEYTSERRSEIAGVERVATSQQITTEDEVTTPATPDTETSKAFASASEVIARKGTQLHLKAGSGPKIRIDVGEEGASLQDLAASINADAKNLGRVHAEVISSPEGFRLFLRSTDTGADAELDVSKDSFKPAPSGKKTSLIDGALATEGQDASSETVTTTETIEGSRRKVTTREIETKQQVDDEEFEALVQEFVAAYNAVRSFTDEENLDLGDQAGLLGNDERVRDVAQALDEIASGLGERSSGSGALLADLGIELGESGELLLDAERLHQAIESDATSVIELLDSEEGGLGQAVADALAPAEEDPQAAIAALRGGLTGFLDGLAQRERELGDEANRLQTVLSSISSSPGAPEPA